MKGVAVVVPCYNLGRTVVEALDSVGRQTRPATEVIVVDDGSDDPYTSWVLAKVERDGTQIVRTPNRGVAAARNLGVYLTHSPYLVLLDADDVLEPEYLERLAAVLDERSEIDFVTCGMRAFGDASYVWTPAPCTWVQTSARGGPHISTMFRRSLWQVVGGFDEGLTGYEDHDFWLTVLERNFHGEVLPEPLLRYRVRAASRYRRAILRDSYVRTMERIHQKHPPPTAQDGRNLLLEKEAFLADQRSHHLYLQSRWSEHERTLAELTAAIEKTASALTTYGKDALDWGDLRRVSPISPVWGLDRGRPLDRYYIEKFLDRRQADIRGRVLEIKDSYYSTRFGGTRVEQTDVLDIDDRNPQATVVADLTQANEILPSDTFDCFILTQTLHIIYDIKAVLANAYRILKPGGVLLCTVPCVSRISYEDGGLDDGDFWRFTEASIRAAMCEVFPADVVEITTHGNVMVCAAFLLGLDPGEISVNQLDEIDPGFPLICCIRAAKPRVVEPTRSEGPTITLPQARSISGRQCGAVLLYHRIGSRIPDIHGMCVDVAEFSDQMRYVRDHCRPMTLHELVEAAARQRLPHRAVAITFDDGYLENLTVASPILLDYGLPATFFVNTDRLDEEHECWWDLVENVMFAGSPLPPVLDLFEDGRWLRSVTTAAERLAAHRALVETVYALPAAERSAIVRRVCEWSALNLTPRPTHRPMTEDELVQLAALPGHAIGAHTVHHLSLPHQSPEVQSREVIDCKVQLERLLKKRVTTFAYPFGEYSRKTLDIVRAGGFEVAVTVEASAVGVGTERLLLPRFEVGAHNSKDLFGALDRAFASTGAS
jgi:peptidoglycan/xylan/chitin deacetylase (PgdA/CDA1 family)/glycosyltransferase involved in cell wall biosynthesis